MARARGTRGIVAYRESESWCGFCGEKVAECNAFRDGKGTPRHKWNRFGKWCGRVLRQGKRDKHRNEHTQPKQALTMSKAPVQAS
jgi:hypothetical protein